VLDGCSKSERLSFLLVSGFVGCSKGLSSQAEKIVKQINAVSSHNF
jgi:hypothetical protein